MEQTGRGISEAHGHFPDVCSTWRRIIQNALEWVSEFSLRLRKTIVNADGSVDRWLMGRIPSGLSSEDRRQRPEIHGGRDTDLREERFTGSSQGLSGQVWWQWQQQSLSKGEGGGAWGSGRRGQGCGRASVRRSLSPTSSHLSLS